MNARLSRRRFIKGVIASSIGLQAHLHGTRLLRPTGLKER